MITINRGTDKYLITMGWLYFGILRSYDGDDATAGLRLSENWFYIGKRLR